MPIANRENLAVRVDCLLDCTKSPRIITNDENEAKLLQNIMKLKKHTKDLTLHHKLTSFVFAGVFLLATGVDVTEDGADRRSSESE